MNKRKSLATRSRVARVRLQRRAVSGAGTLRSLRASAKAKGRIKSLSRARSRAATGRVNTRRASSPKVLTRGRKAASTTRQAPRTRTSHKPVIGPTYAWTEYTLIGIVVVAALCVGGSAVMAGSFDPERDLKNAIERLADDYYAEYLYPTVSTMDTKSPEKILASYSKRGLPIIRLRQMLYYNDDVYNKYAPDIFNQYHSCDTTNTTVHFTPVYPYGPTDFTKDIRYSCDQIES